MSQAAVIQSAATEQRRRALVKAFSWRAIASLDTLLLSFVTLWVMKPEGLSGGAAAAGVIAALEVPNKLLLFYFHERLWNRIRFGRVEGE